MRALAAAWFGGAVGALVSTLAVWLVARADLLAALGVAIAPRLSGPWLGQRLVWGSLWALGYPLLRRVPLAPVRAGLLLSLAPSAAQLLYFAPSAGHGLLGLELGSLYPLLVLAANALWGFVVAHVAMAAAR